MDSRFSFSYFRRSDASAEEVLEDSEPEREERRRIRKISKARGRQPKQNRGESSGDVVHDIQARVQQSAELPSVSRGPSDDPSTRRNVSVCRSVTPVEFHALLSPETRSSPPESPNSFNPSIAEDAPVQPKTLDLARFAYTGGAGPSKPRSTRSPSRGSSVVEVAPPQARKKKPQKAASKTFISSDDPELDFALLFKCPSCRVKWTTTKTAPHKADHIRKCASKQGMTEEAAREVIRRDIADAASCPPPKGKGKGKAKVAKEPTSVHDAPKSYLDNVVEDAAPKKRQPRRKLDVTVTVQPPTATHSQITERAKVLLANTQSSADLHTTSTLSSAESDVILLEDAPPPTQPFLKSKLATAFRRPLLPSQTENQPSQFEVAAEEALALFEGHGSTASGKVSPERSPFRNSPPEPLAPLSQTFDTSPSLNSGSVHRKGPPSIMTISSDGESIASLPTAPSTSRKTINPSRTGGAPQFEGDVVSDGDNGGWSDANSGCLIWDGNPDSSQLDPTFLQQWRSDSESESRASPFPVQPSSSSKPPVPSTPNPSTLTRRSQTTKQKKPRTKKGRPEAVEASAAVPKMSDEELFTIFKNMIEQDEALHCQILRYEPVNIKVFLQKAEALGLLSPRLPKQMKTFLDAAVSPLDWGFIDHPS
ncbi:hypothetical protein FS837_012436 [Tulasnella sp. UAMH 9824]|nr:hypothetical protein FS837_012436 [Tulasnella sp. UAMH 9824]